MKILCLLRKINDVENVTCLVIICGFQSKYYFACSGTRGNEKLDKKWIKKWIKKKEYFLSIINQKKM